MILEPVADIAPEQAADIIGIRNQRDRHIRLIAEKGRMAWQKAAGYGRRSHAEMVCSQSINSA
jgi:hypothetical protein